MGLQRVWCPFPLRASIREFTTWRWGLRAYRLAANFVFRRDRLFSDGLLGYERESTQQRDQGQDDERAELFHTF